MYSHMYGIIYHNIIIGTGCPLSINIHNFNVCAANCCPKKQHTNNNWSLFIKYLLQFHLDSFTNLNSS